MNFLTRWAPVLALVLLFAGHTILAQEDPAPKDKAAKDKGKVVVVPFEGEVGPVLLFVLRRGFNMAKDDESVRALIIEMDTPGGRLDTTKEIIDWIRACRVPVYVFVNREAISAGAIVSLATKGIYMAPGGSIGCATPIMVTQSGEVQELGEDVTEKIKSYTRTMVRSLAQENGYWEDLAEAMVDRDKEVKVGDRIVCPAGKLLTLTTAEAVEIIPPRTKPLLAKAVVKDAAGILALEDLAGATLVKIEITSSDKLARWLTAVAPILMLLAILGLYAEMKTPGFGIPGVISVICFGLFIFGHQVAGLSGAFEGILIILGVILLLVEIFVIPGFGFAGIAGIVCLLIGCVMAMVPHIPNVPDLPGWPTTLSFEPFFRRALLNFAISLFLAIIGVCILSRLLPNTSIFGRLVLQGSASVEAGYIGTDVAGHRLLVGHEGAALTDLHPAGIALIDGQRVDVVSVGDFIEKGARVVVREVNGPRVAVGLAPKPENSEPED